MLNKVFRHGTGRGAGPVDYCISPVVPAYDPVTRARISGQFVTRHPPPVVMEGDPARTRMLIDSSENKWKYTSGVLSFELSDNPSDDEQRAVMADFERVHFAGLEDDAYDILWVKHEHEGNVELHYVTPRIELTTGKSLNIAPPGHLKMSDAWRDTWNYAKGWASPDEPGRARMVVQSDHVLKTDAARLKAELPLSDDPKRLVTEYLLTCFQNKERPVQNRADIVAVLAEAEIEVTRQGKDYISVRPEPGAKPIRLKGIIYDERFEIDIDRANALRSELGFELRGQAESQNASGSGRNPESDRARADAAATELARLVASRASYNKHRYQQPRFDSQNEALRLRERDKNSVERRSDTDQLAERIDREDADFDRQESDIRAGTDDYSTLTAAERIARGYGAADTANGVADEVARSGTASRLPGSVRRDLGLLGLDDSIRAGIDLDGGSEAVQDYEGRRLDDMPSQHRPGKAARESMSAGWTERLITSLKDVYDRTRSAVINGIQHACGSIRRGLEAFSGSHQQLVSAGADLERASNQLAESTQRAERASSGIAESVGRIQPSIENACRVIKMNRDDELASFKTAINIVDYAQSLGYQTVPKESSRSSTVMVRDGDKIIVATDQDGHGIFFSVRDDADNGTIIDFVQRRQGLNLGQVRKALRPWIGGTQEYVPLTPARKPDPSTADRRQVLATWSKMQPCAGHHAYLEQRGISPRMLADPRFAAQVRIDQRGNAAFPHYDASGLAGYELKNDGFTGFSSGGTKAVWHSGNLMHAARVVIVESAIDALSHAQMTGDTGAAYISTGGAMSGHQRDLVRSALAKVSARGAEIVLATDNDEAGRTLAGQLRELAPEAAAIYVQVPGGKDWNDDLQRARHAALAIAERGHGMSGP